MYSYVHFGKLYGNSRGFIPDFNGSILFTISLSIPIDTR